MEWLVPNFGKGGSIGDSVFFFILSSEHLFFA